MEENFKVYCHENKINGKKYFGITKKVPEKRWRNGKSYMENKYFSNAIFKNGWDGFDHIVLFENLSKKMACEIEIYLISKYNTTNQEYGYNLASGGEHPSPTKEIILKMSIPIVQLSLDGKLINTYSGSKDAERKNNNFDSSAITFCCKGKQSKHKNYLFMYEKDYKLITKCVDFDLNKINISKFIKEQEEKRNIYRNKIKEENSIYRGENKISRLSKKVIRFSLDGEILGIWEGSRKASRELKIGNALISACCNGVLKTTNNSIFMYYEEYIKLNKEEVEYIIKERSFNRGNRIAQLTIDGNFIKEWRNQKEAGLALNINETLISFCCRGINNTAGGFRWFLLEDYYEITEEKIKEKISKEKDNKKIVQLSKDLHVIKIWDRQVDASKGCNIQSNHIARCCKNKLNTAHGYKWMYYKDYIEKYGEII